jgi:hypothetical protein
VRSRAATPEMLIEPMHLLRRYPGCVGTPAHARACSDVTQQCIQEHQNASACWQKVHLPNYLHCASQRTIRPLSW